MFSVEVTLFNKSGVAVRVDTETKGSKKACEKFIENFVIPPGCTSVEFITKHGDSEIAFSSKEL
mgnify:FL=1